MISLIGGIAAGLLVLLMMVTIRRSRKRRAEEIDKEVRQLLAEIERHDWRSR